MDPKELINDLKNNKVKKIRVINDTTLKIDFGRIIGEVKKYDGSSLQNTTWGIVHIDKNGGAHIVPAFPDKFWGVLWKIFIQYFYSDCMEVF